MSYEVQTQTVADGWINTWFEDDKPQEFVTIGEAQWSIDDFFDCLRDAGMLEKYSRDDYRIVDKHSGAVIQPENRHRFELIPAIEAVADMHELGHAIQQAISTAELCELFDILADLYEPTDDAHKDWPKSLK